MAPPRSLTGNHNLLPSNNKFSQFQIPTIPLSDRSFAKVTGGVVLWRIWPAVVFHTIFAVVVVSISKRTQFIAIPNVLITLLGVVIGFVISLRVSSGYDRYWWGRCAWSDLVKLSRTMTRLVWIHVPAKINKDGEPTRNEIGQAMREKRVALELLESFAVALKHYLRGELGIYYEDLYPIVRPFHEHSHDTSDREDHHDHPIRAAIENAPVVSSYQAGATVSDSTKTKDHSATLRPLILPNRVPRRQFSIESYVQLPAETRERLKNKGLGNENSSWEGTGQVVENGTKRKKNREDSGSTGEWQTESTQLSGNITDTTVMVTDHDADVTFSKAVSHENEPTMVNPPLSGSRVVIPPVNSYGTILKQSQPPMRSQSPLKPQLTRGLRHQSSRTSLASSHSGDENGEREPLMPAELRDHQDSGARGDLVPLEEFWVRFGRAVNPYFWYKAWRAHWREGLQPQDANSQGVSIRDGETPANKKGKKHKHRHANRQMQHTQGGKHRPTVAGDGENLPLEIVRCLSEWVGELEARGTASGSIIGGLYGGLAGLEEVEATLERILTTPLPYVYSAHIRHTVWLYLFFLPFQLVESFDWYTIPGTAVAAFFYLGFIAAGDEIEQPFGYDQNDLDLDLFCKAIIHADIEALTNTPFPNAPAGSHGLDDADVIESSTVADVSLGKHQGRHHH